MPSDPSSQSEEKWKKGQKSSRPDNRHKIGAKLWDQELESDRITNSYPSKAPDRHENGSRMWGRNQKSRREVEESNPSRYKNNTLNVKRKRIGVITAV